MANHPRRSKQAASRPPNIEEFDDAPRDKEGLRRIGNWVLIPDYDITVRADGAEHQDWRARIAARVAYGQIVYHGSGDVREGYAAARSVLQRHLSETGRRVKWQIGDGQYLEP